MIERQHDGYGGTLEVLKRNILNTFEPNGSGTVVSNCRKERTEHAPPLTINSNRIAKPIEQQPTSQQSPIIGAQFTQQLDKNPTQIQPQTTPRSPPHVDTKPTQNQPQKTPRISNKIKKETPPSTPQIPNKKKKKNRLNSGAKARQKHQQKQRINRNKNKPNKQNSKKKTKKKKTHQNKALSRGFGGIYDDKSISKKKVCKDETIDDELTIKYEEHQDRMMKYLAYDHARFNPGTNDAYFVFWHIEWLR
eukprot:114123_1